MTLSSSSKVEVCQITESDLAEVWALWLTTGWNDKYAVDERAFVRSWHNSFLTRCIKHDGRVIAIARSNSDGVMYAMIHDVVVDQAFHGQGFGSEIIQSLLDDLRAANIRCIQLMSAEDQSRFYEKLGFKARPANKPGMEFQ